MVVISKASTKDIPSLRAAGTLAARRLNQDRHLSDVQSVSGYGVRFFKQRSDRPGMPLVRQRECSRSVSIPDDPLKDVIAAQLAGPSVISVFHTRIDTSPDKPRLYDSICLAGGFQSLGVSINHLQWGAVVPGVPVESLNSRGPSQDVGSSQVGGC